MDRVSSKEVVEEDLTYHNIIDRRLQQGRETVFPRVYPTSPSRQDHIQI